jgi:predicted metal-dependent enzyme (double-stranded beta helix superfamily)
MMNHLGPKDQVVKNPGLLQTPQLASLGNILRNRFFEDVDRAVAPGHSPIHEAMLRVLADHVGQSDLLEGISCAESCQQYTRELLHAGPGYSILAIVWHPGQMSPIHGHKAWCALGVQQGELVETYLKASPSLQSGQSELHVTGCRQLATGSVTGSDVDPDCYHRVANLGVVPAVSIHVYGTPFARLSTDLNRIWPG